MFDWFGFSSFNTFNLFYSYVDSNAVKLETSHTVILVCLNEVSVIWPKTLLKGQTQRKRSTELVTNKNREKCKSKQPGLTYLVHSHVYTEFFVGFTQVSHVSAKIRIEEGDVPDEIEVIQGSHEARDVAGLLVGLDRLKLFKRKSATRTKLRVERAQIRWELFNRYYGLNCFNS